MSEGLSKADHNTPPVEIQGEMEYEVEKILSKRKRYRKVEYLV